MSAKPSIDPKLVNRVLSGYPEGDASALVNVLHDLQEEFRYLPEEALLLAAEHLGVPKVQMYRVATFYDGFHLKPRGKHVCTVCMGTACHVRGAAKVVDQIERDFKVRPGSTTSDMNLTLETVNCVGACALGPLVMIDGEYHGNVTPAGLEKILKPLKTD